MGVRVGLGHGVGVKQAQPGGKTTGEPFVGQTIGGHGIGSVMVIGGGGVGIGVGVGFVGVELPPPTQGHHGLTPRGKTIGSPSGGQAMGGQGYGGGPFQSGAYPI